MKKITANNIANLIVDNPTNDNWLRLDQFVYDIMTSSTTFSQTEISDFIDSKLNDIIICLKELVIKHKEVLLYNHIEFNEESFPPYIKNSKADNSVTYKTIMQLDFLAFEKLCVNLTSKFSRRTEHCGQSHDNCVDFMGYNYIDFYDNYEGINSVLIGQAKRYQAENIIYQRSLREFVGGAKFKLNTFYRENKIGSLIPVIYAFWTTSDFDSLAKRFAKEMGIWLMNGRTISHYADKFNINISNF